MRVQINGFSFMLTKSIRSEPGKAGAIVIGILPYDERRPITVALWKQIFEFMEAFGYKLDGIAQQQLIDQSKAFESGRKKLLRALKNTGNKNFDVNV